MDRPEKVCMSNRAYKPESVTPAVSGGMDQGLWNDTKNMRHKTYSLKATLPHNKAMTFRKTKIKTLFHWSGKL